MSFVVFPNVSIFKRLAALVYDALVICAFLMLMAWLALLVNNGQTFGQGNLYFLGYLILCTGLFQMWFWCKNGQTIGLLAWRLKLSTYDQKPVSVKRAALRFLISIPCLWCFGIGYVWCFFDKDGQWLQDRLAGTRIDYLPVKAAK